jgi:hypothetical protein
MIYTIFSVFRPMNRKERMMHSPTIVEFKGNVVTIEAERGRRALQFDQVFGPDSRQVSSDF